MGQWIWPKRRLYYGCRLSTWRVSNPTQEEELSALVAGPIYFPDYPHGLQLRNPRTDRKKHGINHAVKTCNHCFQTSRIYNRTSPLRFLQIQKLTPYPLEHH